MVVPQTEIIVSKDGEELLRKTVPPGEYVIGRSVDCDLHVQTALLSRKHARLTVQYYETFIEDLGSSNGTFVAGKQIKDMMRIFPDQEVKLGEASILLKRTLPEDTGQSLSPHSEAVRRHVPASFGKTRKYEVGNVIAQGGMGAIIETEEKMLRRRVAMKRMLNSDDPDTLIRFIEEAQITSQLEHPNIVPVYELSVDDQEQVFYTMKLVRGITLHKVLGLIAEGVPNTVSKYPLAALLGIFQKVCDGLAFAHSKGVLDRDLKPENIMLGEYGEVLVMDWGLARASGRTQGASDGPQRTMVRSARQDHGQMTMKGMVFGTPQFMSPEQARGDTDSFDARTDIYALGGILYNILTLEPPISGEDVGQVLQSVADGRVGEHLATRGPKSTPARPRPHLPGGRIPDALATIARKAMAHKQDDRHASVQELQAEVEAFQGGLAMATAGDSTKSEAPARIGSGPSPQILLTIIGVLIAVIVGLAIWK